MYFGSKNQATSSCRRGDWYVVLFIFRSFFHISCRVFFFLFSFPFFCVFFWETFAESIISLDVTGVLRGVTTKAHLVFKVETGETEKIETRAPINLCLVLDHSGSMSGGNFIKRSKFNCFC
jgi:hypothetical protein